MDREAAHRDDGQVGPLVPQAGDGRLAPRRALRVLTLEDQVPDAHVDEGTGDLDVGDEPPVVPLGDAVQGREPLGGMRVADERHRDLALGVPIDAAPGRGHSLERKAAIAPQAVLIEPGRAQGRSDIRRELDGEPWCRRRPRRPRGGRGWGHGRGRWRRSIIRTARSAGAGARGLGRWCQVPCRTTLIRRGRGRGLERLIPRIRRPETGRLVDGGTCRDVGADRQAARDDDHEREGEASRQDRPTGGSPQHGRGLEGLLDIPPASPGDADRQHDQGRRRGPLQLPLEGDRRQHQDRPVPKVERVADASHEAQRSGRQQVYGSAVRHTGADERQRRDRRDERQAAGVRHGPVEDNGGHDENDQAAPAGDRQE